MPILINDWKLLLSSMILLCSIFPKIKIQWRTIWRSKHQVSDEIKKNWFSGETRCSGLPNRMIQF
jgi:hypothetical protein